MTPQNACFRTPEQFMIKALVFINGCSGEYAPAFSNKPHPCGVLKKGATTNIICSGVPEGRV